MRELIEQLVREKREGEWWDFKQKYHTNLADHNIPSIEMHCVSINDLEVEMLIIKNERLKPYYLTKDEKKRNTIVRAGAVYSRLGDANTPKDRCANPYEIEAMWLERFGLDLKASDRFIQILIDFKNWNYDEKNKAFYDIDPDYTIEIKGLEPSEGQFWWQQVLPEKPSTYSYYLKYKRVELHKITVIRFHSENLCIPFPDVEYVTYPEKDDGYITDCYCDVFYFRKDSIKYSLFCHIRSLEVRTASTKSYSTPIESQIKPRCLFKH